jgi:outer membrane protein assembly factor BamA
MVPAVGVNRVSAAAFFDIGGAWDVGRRPVHYQRGAGVEVLSEIKLMYALGLQLRLGVARGLDEPKGTRGYLTVGRAF